MEIYKYTTLVKNDCGKWMKSHAAEMRRRAIMQRIYVGVYVRSLLFSHEVQKLGVRSVLVCLVWQLCEGCDSGAHKIKWLIAGQVFV